ncbi:MAG: hypothetical protein LBH44_10725 [Treponema sp.]|jgi:elongation factor Tu|nr:hypothetical protein [Treponema sp.]
MIIEEVFTIQNRGVVVTGKIQNGSLKLNEIIKITGDSFEKKATIIGFNVSDKIMGIMEEGVNAGILLKGIDKSEIEKGYYLTNNPQN